MTNEASHDGRPTVPDCVPLLKQIYARDAVGCCLHVMIDDLNCEQGTADFCLKWAREQGHADCIAAAELMVRMTTTQRLKASRKAHE